MERSNGSATEPGEFGVSADTRGADAAADVGTTEKVFAAVVEVGTTAKVSAPAVPARRATPSRSGEQRDAAHLGATPSGRRGG